MKITAALSAAATRRPLLTLWGASLAVLWFYAVRSGQDVNWDQRNYHLILPHLLLNGGLWQSVAPSGTQSYFNPLALFPAYLAVTHLPPLVATLVIASLQATAFVIAGLICRTLARDTSILLTALGALLCLLSPMALSEAGTTYPDVTTAIPALIAYLLLLRRDQTGLGWRCCAMAGLLLGLAAGLKLTNLIYVFGVPGFFICGTQKLRHRLAGLILAALTTIAGFLLIAGWWHWQVWNAFANPVFPYANNIFHSPDYPAAALVDQRFLPKSGWAIWRTPVYWLTGGSPTPGLGSPSSETNPKDARFLAAVLGITALLTACALRPALRKRCLVTPACGLILAWSSVYLIWLFIFGIHRYMVGIELLTGAVLLTLCQQLPRQWPMRAMLALCAASLIVLHVANWERRPFAAHWLTIAPEKLSLPGRPLIFIGDVPIAVAALSLPDNALYVGLTSEFDFAPTQNTALTRQMRLLLSKSEDRTSYLLTIKGSTSDAPLRLAGFGLQQQGECNEFTLNATKLQLCPLIPASPKTP